MTSSLTPLFSQSHKKQRPSDSFYGKVNRFISPTSLTNNSFTLEKSKEKSESKRFSSRNHSFSKIKLPLIRSVSRTKRLSIDLQEKRESPKLKLEIKISSPIKESTKEQFY